MCVSRNKCICPGAVALSPHWKMMFFNHKFVVGVCEHVNLWGNQRGWMLIWVCLALNSFFSSQKPQYKQKPLNQILLVILSYCVSDPVTQGNAHQGLAEMGRYTCLFWKIIQNFELIWVWTEWYLSRHWQGIYDGYKAESSQAVTKALLQSPVLKVNMRQFRSLCCRVCKFILYQIQESSISFWQHTMHLEFWLYLDFVCCSDSMFLLQNV